MAKQTINLGTAPSGTGGDTPRSAFTKTQANIDELYGSITASYTKANILGTVSQTSNAPTGAIIEQGYNANGFYIKFADGTMICLLDVYCGKISTSNPFGSLFISSTPIPAKSFPSIFISKPICHIQVLSSTATSWQSASGYPSTSASQPFYIVNPQNLTQDITATMIAIGRWF